ncbi:uncharacterized protein LOC130094342 [Rhinichthys klamathensis goyatoka]|uniref:uncharacterized protein LOC130094342 n=1 Tax=Rhinichthys klamathensis goyatoka TaxID=3034132 RepID=UPI0024B60499|nr:uncharacterized protein LOC130094342 [Rhinichthys klamathensis goyatoka]
MIIQIYLYLLIWCQAAETLTNQLTDFGENVTINCDLDEKEVYWFLLKRQDSSVLIMRSFSNSPPFYFNKRFSLKYSVDSKHHIFINNVTIDELGVYYCMSTDPDPQFSNPTRLHIIQPTPLTECQNHTVEQCIQQNQTVVKYIQQNQTVVKYIQQNQTSWQTLTLVSALFNAVLVIVVIGLLKVCAVRRSAEQQLHNTDVQLTPDLQQHLDPNQLQHAEVDSSMLCTNIHPVPVNSTYVTLKLPK